MIWSLTLHSAEAAGSLLLRLLQSSQFLFPAAYTQSKPTNIMAQALTGLFTNCRADLIPEPDSVSVFTVF